ncbi:MAG: VOC family protein [Aeromicrobium sp.]
MDARLHHLIFDVANPRAAAEFWSALLGNPITYDDGEFVVVADSDKHSGIAFQLAPGRVAPTWPGPAVPQQAHLDVAVDDVAQAGLEVVALGARHLADNTYADPAGHPFCLIPRPSWMSG